MRRRKKKTASKEKKNVNPREESLKYIIRLKEQELSDLHKDHKILFENLRRVELENQRLLESVSAKILTYNEGYRLGREQAKIGL